MIKKQKVLILGGGFGGIKTALELADDDHFEVNLISDHQDFRYYPQLYHSATGGSSLAASLPLKQVFKNKPVYIILDSAEKLNRTTKTVYGSSGKKYQYDKLIVALGVVTNYFSISGLEEHAYGIKSLSEAKRFRKHLHELIADQRQPDINYVVIGGGPTGVELAGALPDYIHKVMRNHNVKGSVHVDLVEAAPRLVPRMPVKYSRKIAQRLRRLGVELYLGQTVEAASAKDLMVSGHSIASHSIIWTAGVTNHPFLKASQFKLSDHGRVLVNRYMEAEPDIYVIGDNAETEYSGMAQTALYDGQFVARDLQHQVRNQPRQAYKPKRPIYVTPVGHGWAAVLWGKRQFYGHLGWFVHRAADWFGYRDYEPWWPAGKLWLAAESSESDCAICSRKS